MMLGEPDPDWYLDHVIAPSGPERATIGPARARRAVWQSSFTELGRGQVSSAVALARRQGFTLTHDQARNCGVSGAMVRSLIRRHRWSAPRRGVLGVLPPTPALGPRERPDAAIAYGDAPEVRAAAACLVRPGSVISHHSAAAVHGLPLLGDIARPTLTSGDQRQTCGQEHLRVHAAALSPSDVENWFGVPVTRVARTVVDLARTAGAEAALVAADAALHEGLVRRAELWAAAEAARGWPGVAAARRIVSMASELAESPLESLTRLCLADGGVPPPVLQVWVDAGGKRYRVDMCWPEHRVALEADGRMKYLGPRDGRLWAEKRRQELIERAGYRVVRVSWADVVDHPEETVARVLAALAVPYGSP